MAKRAADVLEAAIELVTINKERVELTMNYLSERAKVTVETFDLMLDEMRELRAAIEPRRPLKRTISCHDLAASPEKKSKKN
jgi:coenzyme F420-reducing hydrogenase delta subunit